MRFHIGEKVRLRGLVGVVLKVAGQCGQHVNVEWPGGHYEWHYAGRLERAL